MAAITVSSDEEERSGTADDSNGLGVTRAAALARRFIATTIKQRKKKTKLMPKAMSMRPS